MSVRYESTLGNVTPLEPGCYVDGHHGQYASERLADLFVMLDEGSYVSGVWRDLMVKAYKHDHLDDVCSLDDAIMDVLNEQTSGGVWSWVDGELFLEETDDEYGHLFGDSDHCSRCYCERYEGHYYDGCN